MAILVTGGAGYIGSIVAQQLIQSGQQVVVYDNLSHGHRAAVPVGAHFIEGEIADTVKLDDILTRFKITAAMHFAALIESGESMKSPAAYFHNNSAGTLNLLDVLLRQGIRKVVFSSTAAVYGNPERLPVTEDARLCPTSVYGESKLIVERMLQWFSKTHQLHYASLRYFNAAGAEGELGEAHQPESHLIPRILQVALGLQENISVYGTDYPTPDGTCIRDYIHVSDLAAAHIMVLNALESQNTLIYNLGIGKGFSVREVIETARKITGHAIPSSETERRPGDPAILVASSEKIQNELGWKPKYSDLESIIQSAWDWQRKHLQEHGSTFQRDLVGG
jgi:UDP-glucose 4-epimerase